MTLRCWMGTGDMGMNVCGCIWQTEVEIQRRVSIHTRISKLHPLRAPGGKGPTAAMSTLRAQVLVFKFHSPREGIRAPCKTD